MAKPLGEVWCQWWPSVLVRRRRGAGTGNGTIDLSWVATAGSMRGMVGLGVPPPCARRSRYGMNADNVAKRKWDKTPTPVGLMAIRQIGHATSSAVAVGGWHAAWRRCGGVVGAGPMVGWGCGGVIGLGMVAATWLTMGVVAAKDAGLAGEAPVRSTSPLSLCAMVVATRRTATTGRRTETRGTQPVGGGWEMPKTRARSDERCFYTGQRPGVQKSNVFCFFVSAGISLWEGGLLCLF